MLWVMGVCGNCATKQGDCQAPGECWMHPDTFKWVETHMVQETEEQEESKEANHE